MSLDETKKHLNSLTPQRPEPKAGRDIKLEDYTKLEPPDPKTAEPEDIFWQPDEKLTPKL